MLTRLNVSGTGGTWLWLKLKLRLAPATNQQINESTNQLLNNKSTISKKHIFAARISIVLPQIRSLIYKEERRD